MFPIVIVCRDSLNELGKYDKTMPVDDISAEFIEVVGYRKIWL